MLDILKRGLGCLDHEGAALPTSRRTLMNSAVLGGAVALVSPLLGAEPAQAQSGRIVSQQFAFENPVDKLKAEFRILRDFKPEADVLMWYFWTVFIVAEGRQVIPFVRYEGIEFSHHKLVAKDVYRAHGHNLSYPRDLNTGVFVERIRNPVTGKDVVIPATVLTEDPGMLFSPAGKRPLDRKGDEFTPTYSLFRIEGDLIKVEEIRVPPDNWLSPFIEASHNWAPKKLFDDKRITRLPSGTSGGFVFPFPKWLEMGDIHGHMVGLWSGRKLDGVHQLPEEFYQRTEAQHPALLKVDLRAFAK